MIKPKTFRELYEVVNLQDLLDVVDFSGVYDWKYEEHNKIRRILQDDLYNSLYYVVFVEKRKNRKEPHNLSRKMKDIDYEIILESICDFYHWSHHFSHIHAHIFKRVMNGLNISIEKIKEMESKIMNEIKSEKL